VLSRQPDDVEVISRLIDAHALSATWLLRREMFHEARASLMAATQLTPASSAYPFGLFSARRSIHSALMLAALDVSLDDVDSAPQHLRAALDLLRAFDAGDDSMTDVAEIVSMRVAVVVGDLSLASDVLPRTGPSPLRDLATLEFHVDRGDDERVKRDARALCEDKSLIANSFWVYLARVSFIAGDIGLARELLLRSHTRSWITRFGILVDEAHAAVLGWELARALNDGDLVSRYEARAKSAVSQLQCSDPDGPLTVRLKRRLNPELLT
jgi:hypothetical protein